MINLYKQSELRSKNKSLVPANKSHTASMNLKVSTDLPCEPQRDCLKHSYRQHDDDSKSRSHHKYKKSLILQETAIQLVKKNSEYYAKNKDIGMSTQRFSKEKTHKRSVDHGMTRMKTEADEGKFRQEHQGKFRQEHQGKFRQENEAKFRQDNEAKFRQDGSMVEVTADELKEIVNRLRHLRSEKENLGRELAVFKRGTAKNTNRNAVLKALA